MADMIKKIFKWASIILGVLLGVPLLIFLVYFISISGWWKPRSLSYPENCPQITHYLSFEYEFSEEDNGKGVSVTPAQFKIIQKGVNQSRKIEVDHDVLDDETGFLKLKCQSNKEQGIMIFKGQYIFQGWRNEWMDLDYDAMQGRPVFLYQVPSDMEEVLKELQKTQR